MAQSQATVVAAGMKKANIDIIGGDWVFVDKLHGSVLFFTKFSEALKTVGKQLDFVDLYTKRNEFLDRINEVICTDLNGYSPEDVAIDFVEQTPVQLAGPGRTSWTRRASGRSPS